MALRSGLAGQWAAIDETTYGVVPSLAAALFYAADNNEIGSLGVTMCQYGGPFCDHPSYVFAGAVLAALWGTFVSVR